MTNVAFKDLPVVVQEEVKDTLRVFRTVDVYFENGDYHFGLVLKRHYADDHKFIGTYRDDEVFTEEERILNCVNEFRMYPPQYKGKRDYSIFKDRQATYKMLDGNIVKA